MANLNDLQEMAKNGEVSKKLLEDEEFKNELKKSLKEEKGVEVTEEQITEIIKNFETALQNEEILKEAELENISGGRFGKAKVVKAGSAVVGAVLGATCGSVASGPLSKLSSEYRNYSALRSNSISLDSTRQAALYDPNADPAKIPSMEDLKAASDKELDAFLDYRKHKKSAKKTSAVVGGAGGLVGGWFLGDYICKKFDIKD